MPEGSSELRLTVIGTGHLGATHAACMADMGFPVLGVDTDAEKTAMLSAGEVPFFEPGLAELLRHNLDMGRLRFTTSYEEAADHGDVHFLCVGTPQAPNAQEVDLTYLNDSVAALAPLLRRQCLVVGKSTVPVGTAARLAGTLATLAPAGPKAVLAWNPEYLREGYAVTDTLHPSRIVIGVPPDRPMAAWAEGRLREIYAPMTSAGIPLIVTGYETAELAKTAANAFLATKISFINAMAEVCESAKGDVTELARTLACDDRIGPKFLSPGLGFGGGCLPKDIRGFRARAAELGAGSALEFLREVDAINDRARRRVTELARELAGGSLAGLRVAVLGGAFKPGSDDVRDSPALTVASAISAEGAIVTVYDPEAMANVRRADPSLGTAPSALDAIRGAQLTLLLTEWAEFRGLSPHAAGQAAANRIIIDARHALDADHWRQAGWQYRAPGRPAAAPEPRAPYPAMGSAAAVLTCVRVGVGASGAIHGQALHRLGVRTLAVLDTDPSHRSAIAAAGLPPCDSYADAGARRPGFWDVCVPTAAHPDVLEAIIAEDPQANILIEKPLCDFADLPRVSELLARHRGRMVVNENYASSVIPAAVADRVRKLGLRITGIYAEMTKNRSSDFLAGRFADESVGALGYEGTHLITVIEALGYQRDLDADPCQVEITDLTLPNGTALTRQGTAFVALRANGGPEVRIYTSMDGLIGHPHPPYAPRRRRVAADDTASRYRMLCVEGTDHKRTKFHVAGFFEPLQGQPRNLGAVATYRAGALAGPPEYIEDDTVARHLTRALAHFGGDPANPFPVTSAVRHVQYLHHWAQHQVRTGPAPVATSLRAPRRPEHGKVAAEMPAPLGEPEMTYQRDFADRLRVAVVGLGGHGYRIILPTLNYLPVSLVAVCDSDATRAEKTAGQYGVRPYTDIAGMLEAEQLDAILLAVSPFDHPRLAVQALERGISVWMEKPPAARPADLDDVIAARKDNIVVVGMKKVFMPAGRKALEILASPRTGPLSSVTARYPVTIPPNAGEILANPRFSHWLNEGCHPLSLMLAAGGTVESVDVHRGGLGDCVCVLGFTSGTLGVLHLSENIDLSQPFERYTFVARGATIEIDNCSRVTVQRGIPYEFGVTTNFAPEGTETGMVSWEPQNSRSSLENQALFIQGFYAELSYFCDCVRARRPAKLGTLEFARHVMEVYEQVLQVTAAQPPSRVLVKDS